MSPLKPLGSSPQAKRVPALVVVNSKVPLGTYHCASNDGQNVLPAKSPITRSYLVNSLLHALGQLIRLANECSIYQCRLVHQAVAEGGGNIAAVRSNPGQKPAPPNPELPAKRYSTLLPAAKSIPKSAKLWEFGLKVPPTPKYRTVCVWFCIQVQMSAMPAGVVCARRQRKNMPGTLAANCYERPNSGTNR